MKSVSVITSVDQKACPGNTASSSAASNPAPRPNARAPSAYASAHVAAPMTTLSAFATARCDPAAKNAAASVSGYPGGQCAEKRPNWSRYSSASASERAEA